jgi:hypothetical protein
VFFGIISMCSERILNRLRLVHIKRKGPKQPRAIKESFQEAITSLRNSENTPGPVKLFVEKAREVMKLIDAWSTHQTLPRLMELVEGIHGLKQVESILDAIPDRKMVPSSRNSLLNIISKVARYREAARFLYRLARKNPLFRRIKVVLPSLPQLAFQKTPSSQLKPDLPSKLSQICGSKKKSAHVEDMLRLLGTNNSSLYDAQAHFAEEAKTALTASRIHAEIQLLYYVDLKNSKTPPRVICSSKDACFLCNTFILMHGKISTPRCHGRLYSGWRLPSALKPELQAQFNRILVNKIRESLNTLVSRRKKTVYPSPNESTLHTLPSLASTLLNTLPPAVMAGGEEGPGQQLLPQVGATPPHCCPEGIHNSAADDRLIPALQESAQKGEVKTQEDAMHATKPETISQCHGKSNSPQTTSSQLPGVSAPVGSLGNAEWELSRGETRFMELQAHETSLIYRAGSLEIQVDYSPRIGRDLADSDGGWRPQLLLSVEWLTAEETERLMDHRASAIINAEVLGLTEKDEVLDNRDSVYISARDSVLRLTRHTSLSQNNLQESLCIY